MQDLSRLVLRQIIGHGESTQAEIAADLGVDRRDVVRALTPLIKGRIVELERVGRRQIPRLAILRAFAEMESSIGKLREAAA